MDEIIKKIKEQVDVDKLVSDGSRFNMIQDVLDTAYDCSDVSDDNLIAVAVNCVEWLLARETIDENEARILELKAEVNEWMSRALKSESKLSLTEASRDGFKAVLVGKGLMKDNSKTAPKRPKK